MNKSIVSSLVGNSMAVNNTSLGNTVLYDRVSRTTCEDIVPKATLDWRLTRNTHALVVLMPFEHVS